MCVPPQYLAQNTSHPPNNNERDTIDITTSPETGKEKPTVPQPTGGSTPQTYQAVLRTEDPPACHLCGSVDPKHSSMRCWQKRIHELGTTNWELGVITPPAPPSNCPPLLSLKHGSGDTVVELFVSPPLSYRQTALTQRAYDDFNTPPNPAAQTPEQSPREELVHRGKLCDGCDQEH